LHVNTSKEKKMFFIEKDTERERERERERNLYHEYFYPSLKELKADRLVFTVDNSINFQLLDFIFACQTKNEINFRN